MPTLSSHVPVDMNLQKNAPVALTKTIGEHKILLLAPVVGVVGALLTEAFRLCLHGVQFLLVGHSGSLVAMAKSLPWYWRICLPCAGGILAGALLLLAKRYASTRSSDYMEAVAIGDGRIGVRDTMVRSASSLSTIASGGSIGREGAMVQLAAMGASIIGQRIGLGRTDLRLLVACGAAAGISAAYNAPIAGAFFISEIVLGTIVMRSLGPVLVASVAANLAMRSVPGYKHIYEMPRFPDVPANEIGLFLLLGLLAGILMPQFLRIVASIKRNFAKWTLPLPLQLGIGGLLVGIISVRVPEVWGNGYSVVNSLLHGQWLWSAVLLVLACKVVATASTIGSGAVGGMFTPTLFLGAAVGNLFAQAANAVWPQVASASYAYSMVGMGAFLSAATGAPLMAIFMIFEMTLSYQIMLPLTLACVVAYVIVRSRDASSMYEITVRRQRHERSVELLRSTRMAELIQPAETVLLITAKVVEAATMFLQHPVKHLYIVDDDNRYIGTVSSQTIIREMLAGASSRERCLDACVRDELVAPLTPALSLEEGLQSFLLHRGERLPIVQDPSNPVLLGVVHKTALLEAYSKLNPTDIVSSIR